MPGPPPDSGRHPSARRHAENSALPGPANPRATPPTGCPLLQLRLTLSAHAGFVRPQTNESSSPCRISSPRPEIPTAYPPCGRLWPTCSRAEHNDCDMGSLLISKPAYPTYASNADLHCFVQTADMGLTDRPSSTPLRPHGERRSTVHGANRAEGFSSDRVWETLCSCCPHNGYTISGKRSERYLSCRRNRCAPIARCIVMLCAIDFAGTSVTNDSR